MNENQYVKNINGYVVKDSGARNLIEQYGRMLGIVNEEVTVVENNYLDMRTIYEIVDDITIGEGESQGGKYYDLPSGFTQSNTRVIYYDLEYTVGANGYSMRYYSDRMGVTITKDQQSNEQIYVGIGRSGSGTEAQTWKIRVGLIKLPTQEEPEEQQGE